MNRTYAISLMTVGITLILLFGIGSPSSDIATAPGDTQQSNASATETPSAVPVMLHVAVSVSPMEFELLESISQSFSLSHPLVDVSFENIPEQLVYGRFVDDTSLGTAPDIMLLSMKWIRAFATDGRLRALDDVVPVESQNRWFETLQTSSRWNGYVWAYPAYWDPYVIVYNSSFVGPRLSASSPLPGSLLDWYERFGNPVLDRWDEQGWAMLSAALSDGSAVPAGDAAQGSVRKAEEIESGAEGGTESGGKQPKEAQFARTHGAMDALESVRRGESAWTLTPLSEALKFGVYRKEADMPLLVTAVQWVRTDRDVEEEKVIPAYTGQSFAISPATPNAELAAEWIAYVIDHIHRDMAAPYPLKFPAASSEYSLPAIAPVSPVPGQSPASVGGAGAGTQAGAAGSGSSSGAFPLNLLSAERLGALMELVDSYGGTPLEHETNDPSEFVTRPLTPRESP